MALLIPNAAVQMKSASAVLPEILSRLNSAEALTVRNSDQNRAARFTALCTLSSAHSCPPQTLSEAHEAGDQLTIIKTSLVGSALML